MITVIPTAQHIPADRIVFAASPTWSEGNRIGIGCLSQPRMKGLSRPRLVLSNPKTLYGVKPEQKTEKGISRTKNTLE